MMNNIFKQFNRRLMAEVHAEVRQRFPNIRPMRDAGVHRCGCQWEFHGPDKFYAHFRAEDAYHARAKGWDAWLAEQTQSHLTSRR